MHAIKEIIHIEPFKLTLKFESGEIRKVDLRDKLMEWGKNPDSKFAELKDPNCFLKVKLDLEFETLVWDNGIDLCPDVLYHISEEKKDKSVA
ncbi:DUF2442 domain-containing protein [Mongoliibacter ruber]|uniref:Uncharacterized protein DUF2442 n=1 Tax=Mongoliibacter ruber TaxID=1750599 RepID=A0A2T0WLI2_9BACT|nr:DUF2442 domain-containing protein [Mongoliibacter ruber]PRY87547.1 uncharacterized protein DUF2442 [Mongoliibacter ruber]